MTIRIDYARDPAAVRRILEALPEWFGDPESIDQYVSDASNNDFVSLLARQGGTTIGVAMIRRHFAESAELHLIAIDPKSRGQGAGRALIECAVAGLEEDGCLLFSVHTVGPSYESDSYAQTRSFYRATDFLPLEEHRNLDWTGPTLILVRRLVPVL